VGYEKLLFRERCFFETQKCGEQRRVRYNLGEVVADLFHGAVFFLRTWRVLSYSGNSPHFMEPEGSSPHSQQPVTYPYPEQDRFSPRTRSHFCKIHFNIILTSTPGSSKWFPSLRLPHRTSLCISLLPYMCYYPCPSRSSWFDHANNIWWGVQSIKAPCYVVFSIPLLTRSS
jgi:hypothetical protein